MRTTVNLDEDTYYLVSNYAEGRGITLGGAIGELIRSGREAGAGQKPPMRLKRLENGMLVLAGRGAPITSEMVKAALEEDD